MTDITGTNSPETLDGTSGADTIVALGGNDTVNAGDGNDTIYGGSGTDTLNGGSGDDLFIEDQPTSAAEVFNGGDGFDTIELRTVPQAFISSFGLLSPHSLSGATSLSSIERIVFVSQSGQVVQGSLLYSGWAAAGITQIVGSAGREFLTISTGTAAGTYTMPNLPLSNWDGLVTNAWELSGDFVVLSAGQAPAGTNVTLNALAGATFTQLLAGGLGNDTINGSANADLIDASRGADQVNAGGGNDSISIINTAAANGTSWAAPTTFDGAGGVFNGGSGTDVLTIGGVVNLQATLQNIEGIWLQPAVIPIAPNAPLQEAAYLYLDSAHVAMLPTTTFFVGSGTVEINLDVGASFNGSAYTFNPGADVEFIVYGGDGNGVTISGTSVSDSIYFGGGNQTATGGGGADIFGFSIGVQTITDFTLGEDRIDLTDTGLLNMNRVYDFMVQQAGGAAFVADSAGQHIEWRLNGIAASALTADHFILDTLSFNTSETGTASADIMLGLSLDDDLHGGDGNDRIYSGGGVDRLFGDGGDDVIVLDGAIPATTGTFGVLTIDGGAGQDRLVLRDYVASGQSNYQLYFSNATPNGFAGIETIQYDSRIGESISSALILEQIQSSGLTTLIGGAGTDQFVSIALNGTSATMPNFTLSNWATGSQGDVLVLAVASVNTTGMTLNVREGLASLQVLFGAGGNDTLNGGSADDKLFGNGGNDTLNAGNGVDELNGGAGDDSLTGGGNIDTAVFSGNRSAYTITQTSTGVFQIVGTDGTDVLTTIEYAQFADQTLRLLPGTGTAVDFNAPASTWMGSIRDFDGNNLGGASSWKLIGSADVDGDGDLDRILVNREIGRFAEVATGPDGLVYFNDYSWAGETRVVGIYIDPEVVADPSKAGGPFDSQRRFQNDLLIDNIAGVLGAGDYDRDGLQEVYFRLTDGTAYLHAYMHADGNIRYANYQSQQQVVDFLTANGWASSTWAGWFPSGGEAPPKAPAGFAADSFGWDSPALEPVLRADSGLAGWDDLHLMGAGTALV